MRSDLKLWYRRFHALSRTPLRQVKTPVVYLLRLPLLGKLGLDSVLVGMSKDPQNEVASKSEFTWEKSLSGFRAKSNSLSFAFFKRP